MNLSAALICPLLISMLTTQYVSGLFLPLEHLENPCGKDKVGSNNEVVLLPRIGVTLYYIYIDIYHIRYDLF